LGISEKLFTDIYISVNEKLNANIRIFRLLDE
jgi:hypothetical protein